MSSNQKVSNDFNKIQGFREGAHYCKMDLHTHTPASECSSFTLPKEIENVLPPKKLETIASHNESLLFLEGLEKGKTPLTEAYKSKALENRPNLTKRRPLDSKALEAIAKSWLSEIRKLYPEDSSKVPSSLKETWKTTIKNAMGDLRCYLKSLFFPEEYILRCYIEGLQVVAVTDHNHPGYIVPRVPSLGTWFSVLQSVNEAYRADVQKKNDPGDEVRRVILERLKLAKKRTQSGFDEESEASLETRKLHDEREEHKKILTASKKRKAHIEERIQFWSDPKNRPAALTILPGVEFTVSNVHILSMFPPKWYVPGRIGSILRSMGIPEQHWGKGFYAAASISVQDTIFLVDAEGGIAIPAHSNSTFKGLLRLFKKGLALNKVLEHDALLSLESIGGNIIAKVDKKPAKDTCETLKWLESGRYRPDREMLLSFVKGSDAHECRIELNGTGEDLGTRFSYVKIDIRPKDTADEVFRSLKLSLMSGQSRIVEHPTEDGYNYHNSEDYRIRSSKKLQLMDCADLRPTILGVMVYGNGSYSDGLKVRFNPYLNCVVGSEGKSTLVRLVAYAFGAASFTTWTKNSWLPNQVLVFWKDGDAVYCIERTGRSIDPLAPNIHARWLQFGANGKWTVKHETPDEQLMDLSKVVDVWPPACKQKNDLSEDDIIAALVNSLSVAKVKGAKPLLVCQTKSIFNSQRVFESVLSKPLFKARQIIWSVFSPNVPTALDAEKIIVIGEIKKRRQLEIICGGDLHEDEIRNQFVNQFEGGWAGFARRKALYSI